MLEPFVPSELTREERLLFSLLVGILVGVALLIIPWLVRLLRRRLLARAAIQLEEDKRPLRLGTAALQRVLQLLAVVTAAVALLLLWDQRSVLDRAHRALGETFPMLSRVAATGVLFLGAYVAISSMKRWVEHTTGRARRFNEHDQEILKRIIQLLILAATALLVLLIWRVDLSGFLVSAGVLGVIIGYAARDTLGSIVAGLVLMFSRPFEIGDWIIVGEDRGIVTDITIVNTRIRSPEGEHVIIPNTEITSQTVRNRSHERRQRFAVDVAIDFSTDIEFARRVAVEAVEELDIVADTPFPSAMIDHLDDSALVLRVRFWVDRPNTEKMWKAKHQVLTAIRNAFEREGVHIPYPHQRFVTDEKATPTNEKWQEE